MLVSIFASIVLAIAAGLLAIARPRDRRWVHLLLILLVEFPLYLLLSYTLLEMSGSSGYRYDQYFFLLDQAFGAPSWPIGRFLADAPEFHKLVLLDYNCSIVISLFAIIWVLIRFGPESGWRALIATALIGGLIPPLYRLFPASGPIYAFPDFPYSLPHVLAPHAIVVRSAPNCMPSAHMASAILVLYLLSKMNVGRLLAGIHVVLTALATLGTGEHYMIDLVAAVPYTALIIWLCNDGGARLRQICLDCVAVLSTHRPRSAVPTWGGTAPAPADGTARQMPDLR